MPHCYGGQRPCIGPFALAASGDELFRMCQKCGGLDAWSGKRWTTMEPGELDLHDRLALQLGLDDREPTADELIRRVNALQNRCREAEAECDHLRRRTPRLGVATDTNQKGACNDETA